MLSADLLKRWEIDRAVLYAVATRAWQFPAGLATTLLIARHFTPSVQGYYYTFSTLLGLQSLVDMGLQWVLLHFASHEWSRLSADAGGRVSGDAESLGRLAAVARLSRRWFLGTTALYLIAVGAVGGWLFVQEPSEVAWRLPWACALLMAAGSLLLSPQVALLEGCNQVLRVNRARFGQAVSASVCVWLAMIAGAQLWTVVVAFGMQFVWEAWLVHVAYRRFWASLSEGAKAGLDWRAEVWPLQWRIGIQSVLRWLAYQLFTPVMFYFHGAEVAGRMGMSWAILSSIQLAAFAPVRTSAPRLGILIAQRRYAELDNRFARVTILATAAFLVALAGFYGLLVLLPDLGRAWAHELAGRFLPPSDIAVLGVGLLALHLGQCLGVYIRAHKKDPLLRVLVVSNLVIGGLVAGLGAKYGPSAAAAGFAAAAVLLTLPGVSWTWWTTRRAWHLDSPPVTAETA